MPRIEALPLLLLFLSASAGEGQAPAPEMADPANVDAGVVELAPLTGDAFCLPGGCSKLALSEDGLMLASASGRRTIEIMGTSTGPLVRILDIGDGPVRCCALVGSPPRLFVGGALESLVEWEPTTSQEVARYKLPFRGLGHMSVSPTTGDLLVTGAGVGIVRLKGKTVSFEAIPNQGRVTQRSEFSRDGKRLLIRDVDGGLRVLEANAPFPCLWEGRGPGVLFGAGGDLVIRSGKNLEIHRIGADDTVETLPGLGEQVKDLLIFVGGSRVLARTEEGELLELDLDKRSTKQLGYADVVAERPVNGEIFTAGWHGAVSVRDVETGKVLREATVVPGPVIAFPAENPSGRIALGTRNGFVVRFGAAGTTREVWRTGLTKIDAITRNPKDGDRIIAVGASGRKTETSWWTSDSSDLVSPRLALGESSLLAVSRQSANDTIQVLDLSGRIAILRGGDIERFVNLDCGHHGPGDGAFSSDGLSCLAALCDARTVYFDIATGRQTELSRGFGASVLRLMFSPDDSRMCALLWSDEVVLWKHVKPVPTFQCRFGIKGLTAFSFCRCGKHAYGGTDAGFVVVVDLESRKILRRSLQLQCGVGAVGALLPQDDRPDRPCGAIVAGLMDGEVFVEK